MDWRILRVEGDPVPFLVLCKAPGADGVSVLEFATLEAVRARLAQHLGTDPARGQLLAQLARSSPDFGTVGTA